MEKNIHSILEKYFGYGSFRPFQEEIIQSVLEGKDTLALLPTGGGKSVCFQVPAIALDGICLVITPLIALMKDQVERLVQRGLPALSVHSGMSRREIDNVLDRCAYDNIKFLYLSPERLQSELFQQRVLKMKVSLLAVDEAHCISQWGYDFRPHYLLIKDFRELIPGVPVVALTATATPEVQSDIQEKLGFALPNIYAASFARKNLSYSAFPEEDKEGKILKVLKNVQGSAVVYVRNRKKAKDISDYLRRNKISSAFYHAGMDHKSRSYVQEGWIGGRYRVIVATNAFGMGIDKPDVRAVVHYDLPENLESYYQEAGRAGRDERNSFAVLLFNQKDVINLDKKIKQLYPSPDLIRRVYQCLANFYKIAVGSASLSSFDFDFNHFIETYKLPKVETFYAMKRLEHEGFIQMNDAYYTPSKIHILVDNTSLYQFQLSHREYDSFIKMLLRLYGGELFTHYVSIFENDLSKHLGITLKEVYALLSFLDKSGIVSYDRQKEVPQVVFSSARHDAGKLPLDIKAMEERKKNDLEKAQAIIQYAQNGRRCRTIMLLEYFGELKEDVCGICDNCIKNRKAGEDQFMEIRKELIAKLSAGSLSIAELLIQVKAGSEKDRLDAIRKMLDSGELILNGEYLKLI